MLFFLMLGCGFCSVGIVCFTILSDAGFSMWSSVENLEPAAAILVEELRQVTTITVPLGGLCFVCALGIFICDIILKDKKEKK